MMRVARLGLLVCVGVLGVLALYSALGTLSAEHDYPPIGEFVEVDGVRLHYVDAGEGKPIVLLHGASSTLREFTVSIVTNLSDSYRVIAFDRPGYGYSERPAGRWPDPAYQARLFRGALGQLGVDQPILVGHSWSGSVALAYMLDYPEDVAGSVLLAGVSHPWEGGVYWTYDVAQIPVLGELLAGTLLYPVGQLKLDDIAVEVFAPNAVVPGHLERTGAVLALRPGTFLANAEDVGQLSDYLRGQSQRYGDIERPLLLITGDSDGIVPPRNHAERLIKVAPWAQLEVLPNAGHALHHIYPERVSALIKDFGRRVWDGKIGT
jgi:pimeloyl-ACP methyl ester carboxylesterase